MTSAKADETAGHKKVRILLADDHATVREGLKLIVNSQPDLEVVGEAGDGSTTLASARSLQPDLVVLDISMPGTNGLRVAETLGREWPAVRVLALTRHSDDGYLHQLLAAGVAGYVLKQSRSSELLHAIRAVVAGGTYIDPAIAHRALRVGRRQTRTDAGTTSALSNRESEVLRLIAWGYSNKEIAGRLDLSVKTIETHKSHAMQKLGMTSRIDVVRYALMQGWLESG